MAMGWVYDPHSGGVKIPPRVKEETERRILAHANKNYAGKFTRIEVRFRGALCYVDAFEEPDEPDAEYLKLRKQTRDEYMEFMRKLPQHLVRLRHFTQEKWSVAFYSYGSESYEPSMLPTGKWEGTPEECFEIGAMYLMG